MSLAFLFYSLAQLTTLWQVNKLLVNLDTFTVGSDKMKICLRFIMTAIISHLLFTLIYINLYIYFYRFSVGRENVENYCTGTVISY